MPMLRRTFVTAGLGLLAAPAALAQPTTSSSVMPPRIEPQNDLETAFLMALDNETMRPMFRRQLLDSHLALALANNTPESPPREVSIREGVSACLLFTSAGRLNSVLGTASPRVILTGRAALERLRGKNVILNMRLNPMLTLEASDIATYLAAEGSSASAGPTQ